MTIEPTHYYTSSDPEMRPLGKEQTLAAWRSHGRGPAYIKMGRRVLYRGADILNWIEANRVPTEDA
ncbi:helix-turn-helix domain-containing protein [uncultured Roseovarius sp.]|uniref:helix-turn-helix transcriptional regulator n=1 Tax=uncultured Roseovarius sp. TaxID=293344 RepID=UPI00263521F8|nr:helix-turn-helix domain-containing protein [uncultured Roseovarius sp.]